MAVELINIGNIANDGTGDELRVAFRKINQNLEDFDIRLGDEVEGLNTGLGVGIFKGRTGNDLEFRSLVAGSNIEILGLSASIEISAPNALTSTPFITDSGSYILTAGNSISLVGGTGISTRFDAGSQSIVIDSTSLTNLIEDSSPALGGDLNANLFNITNVDGLTANIVTSQELRSNLTGTIEGFPTSTLMAFFNGLDFGPLTENVTSFFDLIVLSVDVEFGTISIPSGILVDMGTF